MKVQATDVSKRFKLKIKELGRIAEPDEVFEVTRDRFVVLSGSNPYRAVFVKRYVDPSIEEQYKNTNDSTEQTNEVAQKPKKRGRKKKESLDGAESKK